jgi:hypothetical protein
MLRRLLTALLVIALLCWAAVLLVNPVDRVFNRTVQTSRPVSAPAQALHDSLWIADFHSDALLWPRSLLDRHSYGLVDLPRLRDGALISWCSRPRPACTPIRTITARRHSWTFCRGRNGLTLAPCSPGSIRMSARAALAAKRREEADASRGSLRLIATRDDLDDLVRAQSSGDSVVAAVLSIEGMHAIDGDIARVDSLFASGYRIFGITHMFDNDVGGSSSGWRKGGLTPLGRRVVARIDSLGGIIDLAHASRATIEDVLALTTRPVLVSHTGLTSMCAGPRNLDDALAVRIAQRGGIDCDRFLESGRVRKRCGGRCAVHSSRHRCGRHRPRGARLRLRWGCAGSVRRRAHGDVDRGPDE